MPALGFIAKTLGGAIAGGGLGAAYGGMTAPEVESNIQGRQYTSTLSRMAKFAAVGAVGGAAGGASFSALRGLGRGAGQKIKDVSGWSAAAGRTGEHLFKPNKLGSAFHGTGEVSHTPGTTGEVFKEWVSGGAKGASQKTSEFLGTGKMMGAQEMGEAYAVGRGLGGMSPGEAAGGILKEQYRRMSGSGVSNMIDDTRAGFQRAVERSGTLQKYRGNVDMIRQYPELASEGGVRLTAAKMTARDVQSGISNSGWGTAGRAGAAAGVFAMKHPFLVGGGTLAAGIGVAGVAGMERPQHSWAADTAPRVQQRGTSAITKSSVFSHGDLRKSMAKQRLKSSTAGLVQGLHRSRHGG
jgi:hypothetical protein